MSISEKFEEEYGKEALIETLAHSGKHSKETGSLSAGGGITLTDGCVLVFGLLEILDYECCKYDCYTILSKVEIKNFLLKHKAEVIKMIKHKEIEYPSFLGFVMGAFDFLSEDVEICE